MSEPTRVSADEVRQATERRRRREARGRWTRMLLLALIIFTGDQIVKIVVRAAFDHGQRRDVFPGLELARITNEGIAFGLFPGRQGIVAAITVIALCGIAVALAGAVRRNSYAATGAGLLGGGSLGNLTDRLVHGGVTDYIHFTGWPLRLFHTFNLADTAIVVGAGLIVLGLVQQDAAAESDS